MKASHFSLLAALALGALVSACEKPQPPPPQPASMADGDDCSRDRNWACAEANYRGYLQQYPSDVRANAVLAITLSRESKHREALPFFQKAIDAGAGTYDLFANYALSLDATGDVDGAIKWNRRALDAVPTLVDVRGSLAQQLVRKGQTDEALKLLRDFDRGLVKQGHQPYFTAQIAAIEDRAAKDKAASAAGAAAPK